MVMEILVPVGVLLHWTKFFEVVGLFPLLVSIFGFIVITCVRIPIQFRLIYLFFSNWNLPNFPLVPTYCHYFLFGGFSISMVLEYTWGMLYLQNIQKLLSQMKKPKKNME